MFRNWSQQFIQWDATRTKQGKFPVSSCLISILLISFIAASAYTTYVAGQNSVQTWQEKR